MRAWQISRDHPPSTPQDDQPSWTRPERQSLQPSQTQRDGSHARDRGHANDDDPDEDAPIRVAKRDDIVPRRPGASANPSPSDDFWTSHLFWKGILVGALTVLLVKTVIAVQAPHGVDWYGF